MYPYHIKNIGGIKLIRKIIKIDEQLCNGCGACAEACHEGAIAIQNGKAVLVRDDYCDGLGNCLPTCPTNAISFEEREAMPFNQEAVKQHQKTAVHTNQNVTSKLQQWPVQLKLVAENAEYFSNSDLLIAADCTAYAYGNFHNDFMNGKTTIIGCTKLDMVDYSEKLTNIFCSHDIKNVTVVRMEVPCCGGMEFAVKKAIENSKKEINLKIVYFLFLCPF